VSLGDLSALAEGNGVRGAAVTKAPWCISFHFDIPGPCVRYGFSAQRRWRSLSGFFGGVSARSRTVPVPARSSQTESCRESLKWDRKTSDGHLEAAGNHGAAPPIIRQKQGPSSAGSPSWRLIQSQLQRPRAVVPTSTVRGHRRSPSGRKGLRPCAVKIRRKTDFKVPSRSGREPMTAQKLARTQVTASPDCGSSDRPTRHGTDEFLLPYNAAAVLVVGFWPLRDGDSGPPLAWRPARLAWSA